VFSELVSKERESGDRRAVLAYARKIDEAMPEDKQIEALVAEFSTGG